MIVLTCRPWSRSVMSHEPRSAPPAEPATVQPSSGKFTPERGTFYLSRSREEGPWGHLERPPSPSDS